MLVSAAETFDVAESVTARFLLPSIAAGKAIETDATVVRSEQGEYMALQFARMSEEFREVIAKYIESNTIESPL